jgi:hypothetical protein
LEPLWGKSVTININFQSAPKDAVRQLQIAGLVPRCAACSIRHQPVTPPRGTSRTMGSRSASQHMIGRSHVIEVP